MPRSTHAGVAKSPASSAAAWSFIGPLPITNAFVNSPSLPPALTAVTGRASTLAADPQARGRLFVGEASGGLWRSNDGGVSFRSVFDS